MWQLVGQEKTLSLLQRSLEKGLLSHAYLLVGPPHVGKMTLAINLAQALNCESGEPPCGKCASCLRIASGSHSDVQVIGLSEGKGDAKAKTEISIEQIRDLQHSANLPPFEGKYKVYIINGAEQLSNEAANCLLKTLEEPAGHVVFILLAANERQLLPTVVSRCQRLELLPLGTGQVEAALAGRGIPPERATLLARLSRGCLGWALLSAGDESLLETRSAKIDRLVDIINSGYDERFAYAAQLAAQFGQNREAVQEQLGLWLEYWRDLLLVRTGCSQAVTDIDRLKELEETAASLEVSRIKKAIQDIQAAAIQLKMNVSPRLALENLMLCIPLRSKVKND